MTEKNKIDWIRKTRRKISEKKGCDRIEGGVLEIYLKSSTL